MNKKKIFIGLGILAVICVVLLIVKFFFFKGNEPNDYQRTIEIMKNSNPTDVYLLGDELSFDYDLKYNQISDIDTWTYGNERINIFIINDLNNSVELTDTQIDRLSKFIDENNNCLIYYGSKYFNEWNTDEMTALAEDNKCSMWFSLNGKRKSIVPIWNEQDSNRYESNESFLGNRIILNILSYFEEII